MENDYSPKEKGISSLPKGEIKYNLLLTPEAILQDYVKGSKLENLSNWSNFSNWSNWPHLR